MQQSGGESKSLLSVVTPISRMSGRLENLANWLLEIGSLPIQVIIVHDVQDELTGPELDGLVASLKNSKITLIHKYCGSPGTARNLGLKYALADWVCFWDSDDRPRVPEFLELITRAIEFSSDYCVGSYLEISSNGYTNNLLSSSRNFEPLQLLQNPGIWRMGFSRDFIKNAFFAESRMAEDQFFLCNLDLLNGKIYITEHVVYEYQTNFENQLTSKKTAMDDIPQVLRRLHTLRTTIESPERVFFLDNVITRVSLTGLKKASLKTKVEICRMLLREKGKVRVQFGVITSKILKNKLSNLFLSSESPSLRIKLYGGLGNQLFQLAAGLSIAGTRRLILEIDLNSTAGLLNQYILPSSVDVEFYESKNKKMNVYQRLCNLNLRLSTHLEPSFVQRRVKSLFRFLLTLLLCLRHRHRVEVLVPDGLGYSDLSTPARQQYLLGYLQSYIWTENSGVLELLKSMRLRKRNFELDSYLREVATERVLAVHVRLGDYLSNPQFGQLNEDYYQRAIQAGLNRKEFDRIWVFSDDMPKAKILLGFLGAGNLEINWVNDAKLSAPEIMKLISSCAGIVLANSSFGWWGARLSGNLTRFISIPDPWFGEIDSPRLLVPNSWVRTDAFYGNSRT